MELWKLYYYVVHKWALLDFFLYRKNSTVFRKLAKLSTNETEINTDLIPDGVFT